jgi:hypothetical protein
MASEAQQHQHLLTLRCRVYMGWLFMSRGTVTIDPGVVTCEFRPLLGIQSGLHPVVHRGTEVVVTHVRVPYLLTPTTIRLIGEDGRLVDVSVDFRLPRIRAALEQAGFVVTDRRVWVQCIGRGPGPATSWPTVRALANRVAAHRRK